MAISVNEISKAAPSYVHQLSRPDEWKHFTVTEPIAADCTEERDEKQMLEPRIRAKKHESEKEMRCSFA
jgi:hypothetical protein